MTKKKLIAHLGILLALFSASCKKDEQKPSEGVNEEVPENITTVILKFSPLVQDSIDTASFTVTWSDPDGVNGNEPEIDPVVLRPGRNYAVSIGLWDHSDAEPVDLTSEIEEEAKAHIFCYTPAGGADLDITRTDTDGTFKVGLETTWFAGNVSEGKVGIVLKHQPGGKDGTCDQGETDVDVVFPIVIEN